MDLTSSKVISLKGIWDYIQHIILYVSATYLCYSDIDVLSQMQRSLHFLLGLGYIVLAKLHPLLRGCGTATINLEETSLLLDETRRVCSNVPSQINK